MTKKIITRKKPIARNNSTTTTDIQLCMLAIKNNNKKKLDNLIRQNKALLSETFNLNIIIGISGVPQKHTMEADLLLYAVYLEKLDIVQFLVNEGASLTKLYKNCPMFFTGASLLFCSLILNRPRQISEYLSTLPGIDVNAGGTEGNFFESCLYLACGVCPPVAMNLLNRDELKINQPLLSRDLDTSALIMALKVFLEAQREEALTQDHRLLIERILRKYQLQGAPIPLDCFYFCCHSIGDKDLVELFINFGIEPTVTGKFSFVEQPNLPLETYNALYIAVQTKNKALVQYLITKYPETVLGRAQCYLGEENANINLAEITGLMSACIVGDFDIAQLIADSNNDCIFEKVALLPVHKGTGKLIPIKHEQVKPGQGIVLITVFRFACESENRALITYLLEKIKGANVDEQTKINHIQSGFSYFITKRNDAFFDLFLDYLNKNFYSEMVSGAIEKMSPLTHAIHLKSWEITKQLIDLGAMINPTLELTPIDQAKKIPTHLSVLFCVGLIKNSHQDTSPREIVPHRKKNRTKQEELKIQERVTELFEGASQYLAKTGNDHCEQGTISVWCYPLAVAIQSKQTKIFDELIDLEANPTLPIDMNENVSYSLLSLIPMQNNNEDSLNTYLTAVLTLWAECFSNCPIPGISPIITSILYAKPRLLKTLLNHNLLKNDRYVSSKETTLERVMQICPDNTRILIELIEAGCPVNQIFPFRGGEAPLLLICIYQDNKKLFKVLLNHHADIYLSSNIPGQKQNSFSAACSYFKYTKFYLVELVKYRFNSMQKKLATDYLEDTNDPVGAAVMADDAGLLSELLKNGFELGISNKIEELASSNNKINILKYLLKQKGKSNSFLIKQISERGYQATEPCKKNYQREGTEANHTHLAWLKNQLNTFFNLLRNDTVQKAQVGKHFVLFRFYETLKEAIKHPHATEEDVKILHLKIVLSLRDILAHQYHYLNDQDFEELFKHSRALATLRQNPETTVPAQPIDCQKDLLTYLVKVRSKINADIPILTYVETIKNVLNKMKLALGKMPEKFLPIHHPSVLGLQECIYQIGECYQSINKMRQWNNEEDCIANWSDETGMGVFAVMESARYVRRALSHEIEEDIYADDFNPYYLEWLGNNIVDLIPNIEKVLSNIVNCATNIQQLDNTLRQSLSS